MESVDYTKLFNDEVWQSDDYRTNNRPMVRMQTVERIGAMSANPRKAKLAEIAQEAGVSTATVSKVVNGRSGVAEETRNLIERLLDKYGYSKPLASTKTARTIEFVVSSLENNGSFEIAKELVYQAREQHIGIAITRLEGSADADACFRDIIDRNPMGVMMLLSTIPEEAIRLLESRSIPYVVINAYGKISDNQLGIDIDNWRGGFEATQHLIEQGHTRIGAITGPKDRQSSIARLSGYHAALRKAGIDADPKLAVEGNYTSDDGYRAACELLDLDAGERPTAVFCFDDLMAVSLYKAAQEHRLSIPEDLSIIGFDDTYPALYLSPALTTIRQPFAQIAGRAISMICDIRDNSLEERYVILPVQLIERDSVASTKR